MPQSNLNCITYPSASTVTGTFSVANTTDQFPNCCVECVTPTFIQEVVEGDVYIPFVLSMEDNTKVIEVNTGSVAYVYDGYGVLQLKERARAGQKIQLQVSQYNCHTKSCVIKVRGASESCSTCTDKEECNISIEDIKVGVTNANKIAILRASVVSSYPSVLYSLDCENWYNTTLELGLIDAGVVTYLYVKPSEESYENIGCFAKYPILIGLNEAKVVTPVVPVIPVIGGSPTNLVATAISESSIHLYWSDNSTNETGFNIYFSTDNGATFNFLVSTGVNEDEKLITGLNPATQYLFKVKANFGTTESDFSNTVTATTFAIGTPPVDIPNPSCLAGSNWYDVTAADDGSNSVYTFEYIDKNGVAQTNAVSSGSSVSVCVCGDAINVISGNSGNVYLSKQGSC